MKVLLVSQYFQPEVGATQNRMRSFVAGLRSRGHEVAVVAEQPNHPAGVFQPGWGRRLVDARVEDGGRVTRLWVITSPRKSTPARVAFYGSFAAGAFAATLAAERPDVVLATSPPLPAALAAGAAARLRRIPFVLDVRDPWPAAAEALGEVSNQRVLALMESWERWLYVHARAVMATTRPFCGHIDAVADRAVSVHVPNGALDELIGFDAQAPDDSHGFVLGYVGNLGLAQGLGIVLDAAGRMRGERVLFRLVGDGPLSEELRLEAERRGLDNVEFRPSVPLEELPAVMAGCHALLVPLRAHSMLDDFVPSKLYDAMAVGRPALVAAHGEAARIASETGCGLLVEPEDGASLEQALRRLLTEGGLAGRMGAAGRAAAKAYARSRQVGVLEDVLEAATGPPVGHHRA